MKQANTHNLAWLPKNADLNILSQQPPNIYTFYETNCTASLCSSMRGQVNFNSLRIMERQASKIEQEKGEASTCCNYKIDGFHIVFLLIICLRAEMCSNKKACYTVKRLYNEQCRTNETFRCRNHFVVAVKFKKLNVRNRMRPDMQRHTCAADGLF